MFAYNPMRLNIGSIGYCHLDGTHGLVSPDYVVFQCGEQLWPDYLEYFIQTTDWSNWVQSAGTGSVRTRIYFRELSRMPIALPSIDEQKAIAETLGILDKKIAISRRINTNLEAIAQLLFKSWFVDFDPVKAKVEDNQPVAMDEATAMLFPNEFTESMAGLIPSGWTPGTLAEFATLNSESWSAKNHPSTLSYIDLANAKENRIERLVEYDFEVAPSRVKRALRSGDSIIGTVRPGNRSFAYIQTDKTNLTASTGFAVLRPKRPAFSEYIYLAGTCNQNISRLANLADGGAYPAVRPDVVLQTPVICPPEPILKAFSEITGSLFKQIQANQNTENQLTGIRDILLPKLISGQLDIPSAKEIANEVAA